MRFLVLAALCFCGQTLVRGDDGSQESEFYHGRTSKWWTSNTGWTNINNVQVGLTNRALSWADSAAECQRLGGVLFDPGRSPTLLYDVANRLYGDGAQLWVDLQYIPENVAYDGMQGPGWFWGRSKTRFPYTVYRQDRYCTRGVLSKVGSSSVTLVGENPLSKNLALCVIDKSSTSTAATTPTTTTTQSSVTTPCTTRIIQATIPQNQTGVLVTLNPTTTLTFSAPGLFQYQQNGCTVIVNVTRAQAPACANSPITLTTVGGNTAPFSLLVNGSLQTVQLPVGDYNYTIPGPTGDCTLTVQVRNGQVVRRLDVTARYPVNCNTFNSGQTPQIVSLFAQKTYAQLNSITGGKVQPSTTNNITVSCSNNLLTVTWPTNTTYTSATRAIPTQLFNDLQNAFKQNPNIFDLVLPNAIPPVISPLLDLQGQPATAVLQSLCTGNKVYNPATDSCI